MNFLEIFELNFSKTDIRDKIAITLSFIMKILIIFYIFYSLYSKNFLWFLAGIFSFILAISPIFFKKKYGIVLPCEIEFLLVFSLYLYFIGNVNNWYSSLYPIYDKISHFFTSMTIALLGFVTAVIVDKYTETKMNRHATFFLILLLTISIGALWEIGEYLLDIVFSANYQVSLNDTMLDLIFDTIGGLVVAIFGFIYLKKMPKEHFTKIFLPNIKFHRK